MRTRATAVPPALLLSVLALATLQAAPCSAAGDGGDGPARADRAAARQAAQTIRPRAIRAHVAFLSDGLLEGRAPDGRGYQIAARYVAARLEAIGLRPGGAGGGWYQPVPMRKSVVDAEESTLVLVREGGEETLAAPADYVFYGDLARETSAVEAPVVFAGYGVSAPEQGYDDYAGIDVRGAIVAVLHGAPPTFAPAPRAHYSSHPLKAATAAGHGAAGYLELLTPEDQKRLPWDGLAAEIASGRMAWVEADGTPHDAPMALRGAAVVSPAGAVRLFAGAPRSLEEVFAAARAGRPGSFTLPLRARMQVASRIEGFSSPNIVALLPGSDPALRDQYVTYVAHLDHLGHCPAADGDGICHGAFDNASGVAGLLEVARAFAALPQPPRRSILFLFSTGEEKGLLGSDYFAQHPTVPAAGLVGVICIDGLAGILYPSRDIIALGMDDSGLARDVAWAARATGYDISPDPSPQSVGLVRSDQYSFIRRGVPSVVMVSGVASLDPAVDRRAAMRDWGITHYHTPRDSMSEPLDFAQAARGARLNFLAGFSAAQRPDPPAWNPGDFFGARFAGGSAR